jgi:DNA-binding NtrC family response regulator
MQQILVVSSDGVGRTALLQVLNAAGYRASGASSFAEAKRWLTHGSPDLVIADERLGDFNGLHVIMRARAEHPYVSAIVTTPVKSCGLEADARRLNVECLLKPEDPVEWLAPISRVLQMDHAGGSSAIHGTMHAVD